MRVTNLTGHKLPSGYPEGRRIWLNVRFFGSDGNLVREHGAYNYAEARLDTASTTVFETKLASTLLGEGETFHFALADSVAKDNRVPPRGAAAHWTDVTYPKPGEATHAEVRLYYQTASREYIEFLRNENRTNNAGQVLHSLWEANGKSAPELMASALWGELPGDSAPPTAPENLTAQAASKPAINLAWTASTDNAGVAGYGVYRDGGLIATATSTSYNDRNLAANTRYCYIARALDAAGNLSAPSNQACATTPKR